MNEINSNNIDWESMPVKGFEGKPLIDHKSGGLKMVRIQPGCEFPLHQHPNKTEFAFVLEGTLEAAIGEKTYTGHKGTFYQFPVGMNHRLKNPADHETIVLIGALKDEL
jgi:quercetin dioxygenase-like cupin family protein